MQLGFQCFCTIEAILSFAYVIDLYTTGPNLDPTIGLAQRNPIRA